MVSVLSSLHAWRSLLAWGGYAGLFCVYTVLTWLRHRHDTYQACERDALPRDIPPGPRRAPRAAHLPLSDTVTNAFHTSYVPTPYIDGGRTIFTAATA